MAIMNIAAIHILIKSFCGYLRVLMDCVCLKKLSKIISTTNQRKLNQRWGGSPIVNSAAYCFKAKVHSVFVFGHLQWLLHFVLNAHAHKKVATAPDVTFLFKAGGGKRYGRFLPQPSALPVESLCQRDMAT